MIALADVWSIFRLAFVSTKSMIQIKGKFKRKGTVSDTNTSMRRSEPLDEGSRLKQRVAELEGVIREVTGYSTETMKHCSSY